MSWAILAILNFRWWLLANSLPLWVRITFHLINLAPVTKTIPPNKSIAQICLSQLFSILLQFSQCVHILNSTLFISLWVIVNLFVCLCDFYLQILLKEAVMACCENPWMVLILSMFIVVFLKMCILLTGHHSMITIWMFPQKHILFVK